MTRAVKLPTITAVHERALALTIAKLDRTVILLAERKRNRWRLHDEIRRCLRSIPAYRELASRPLYDQLIATLEGEIPVLRAKVYRQQRAIEILRRKEAGKTKR